MTPPVRGQFRRRAAVSPRPYGRRGRPLHITVFDIGGTHARWARWSRQHGLADVHRRPSPSVLRLPGASVDELRTDLVEMMTTPVPPGGTAGVSLGAALDHRTGIVYASAPLWGAHDEPFDLVKALEHARPDVRWHVVNDVTAALLHLANTPAARDRRKVMVATISSGIACRTIDQRAGRIPVDGCGLQGEIGHLPATVRFDGVPVDLRCDCGQPGHVAAFSSGPGIRRLAEVVKRRHERDWAASALGFRMAGGDAFESALVGALDVGDRLAVALLDAATQPVADVVRTAICLDPEIDLVAFTGGVALGLGEHYRSAVLRHLDGEGLYLTSQLDPGWARDRVVVHEANGLVGAAFAALTADTM